MIKRRYKEGIDRQQRQLLPPSLEEYVAEDNPVRAIDVYVDTLDVGVLGFTYTTTGITRGQPAYPPRAMLKLYLYGYLNRVQSSRRLAVECQRNVEVIWLIGGLRPKYKAIADFRKNNLSPLKAVCRDFVQVCHRLELFGRELASIDGSFFRGNVSKRNIYTQERLEKSLERIDRHIAQYLEALEESDAQEEGDADRSVPHLQQKLSQLKERKAQHQARLEKLKASGETQLAEVDDDARRLSKNGQTVAGYNTQVVVDSKHKLMVVGEVTQAGNDEEQLEPMAKAAKAELEVDHLDVVADAGYFNAQGIKNCQEAGITPFVPEPNKTGQAAQKGRFRREDFPYDAEKDCYRCPAGAELPLSFQQEKRGKIIFHYRSSVPICAKCPLKARCLPKTNRFRSVARWEHEAVIEEHRRRMAREGPTRMVQRASLSEHPFGTLKLWLGWSHFLLRGLEKVQAEFSLWMLSYNFKRVLKILGVAGLRRFCLQRAGMPG